MKVNIGTNIPQSETHGTLELKTNTKKEVKNLKVEQEVQHTEVKEDKKKLFKWEWKL